MKYVYKIVALSLVAVIGQSIKAQTTTDSLVLRGGSSKVQLKANSATPSSYTIQFPTAAPVPGQFLLVNAVNGLIDSTLWKDSSIFANSYWALKGNAGTTGGTNFVGTTDAQDLVFKTNSTYQMHIASTGGVFIGDSLSSRGNSLVGTGARFRVQTLSTDLADVNQSHYAVQGIVSGIFSAAGAAQQVRGGNFLGQVVVPAGVTTTSYGSGSPSGVNIQAWRKGLINGVNDDASSVLAGLAGLVVTSGNNGALGTTTNAYGIYMQPYATSGTITNMYGLYMDPANGSNITNPWGLYINNSYKNYIQGNVGIGTNINLLPRLTVDNNNNGAVPALKLKYPFDGLSTDNILTWNSADSTVRKIAATSLIGNTAWALLGNTGTVAGTNFLGTTDNQDLIFKRNNVQAGWLNDASNNTAFGVGSLPASSTGSQNTAVGYQSLLSNTTGSNNAAFGYQALSGNTGGIYNTAVGAGAMKNGTGTGNVSIGYATLTVNTSDANTAVGGQALQRNTSGMSNTAVGAYTMNNNTTGGYNTALGIFSQYSNVTGQHSTSVGYYSLYKYNSPTVGDGLNVALGDYSLNNLISGGNNIAVGPSAGKNQTAGSTNIMIGSAVDVANLSGSNQMNIGNTIFGLGMTGTIAAPAGNIGINQPAPTNTLEIKSTAANTSGLTFTNLTSTSPVTAGAATLGVDATGKVVTVAAAAIYYKGRVACTNTFNQVITDANVTATSTILLTYEDPNGGSVISVAVGARTAGTNFTVLYGAAPPTTSFINYIIMP